MVRHPPVPGGGGENTQAHLKPMGADPSVSAAS